MAYTYKIYNNRGFQIAEYYGLPPTAECEVSNGNTFMTLGILLVENEKGHYGNIWIDPLADYTSEEIEAAKRFDEDRLAKIREILDKEE